MPDGSLRIKTRLDNGDLDKDTQVLENKIKKLQTEISKNTLEQKGLEEEIQKFEQLTQEADEYKNKIKELQAEKEAMFKANPSLAVTADTPKYAGIKTQITEIQQKYNQTTNEIDKQSSKIDNIHAKLDKVKAKQEENNVKMREYKQKIEEAKRKQLELNYSTEGIGKSINDGITKILRYGMALLSIRSIYGALTSAMNAWLGGNNGVAKQLKSDIDYMKNAIGRALSPVLKYIVNLLYQALGLAGALIKAFTGIDIFAGSVADYMSSTTSSANKTNKELKKQLTSFDKINKLNDNSSSSSGVGGTGVTTPSQDLSQIMKKYTEFAEKVKKVFDDIKNLIPIIGAGILAWKLSDLFFSQLDGLKALKAKIGLTLLIGGLTVWYDGIKQFRNGEITGKSLLKMIGGAVGAGIGVGMLTGSIAMGLSLGLVLLSAGIIEGGRNTLMGMVASKLGLDTSTEANMYLLSFNFELSAKIFGYENFVSLITSNLKNILEFVADEVEKIPIIGQSIANGIRDVIKNSGYDTSKVIKYSSKEAMEKANPWVKGIAKKNGKEARQAYQSGFASLTDETSNIISNEQIKAIKDSTNTINREAYNAGKLEGQSINSGIGSESLQEGTNKLLNTGRETLNNSTMFLEGKEFGTTARRGYDTNNLNVSTSAIVNGAKAILSNSNLYSEGNNLANTIDSGFKKVNFNNTGRNSINEIAQGMNNQKWKVTDEASKIAKDANKVSNNSMNGMPSGANLISGIVKGINDNKASVTKAIKGVANGALSAFNIALGIHSPSRVMADQAKFIPLGIAEGVDSTSDKAVESMKNLVYGMQETVDNMDYSNITQIPKLTRNAVTYVPKQAISTNEVQRSIVGQDSSVLNRLLAILQSNQKGKTSITVPIIIDGEEWFAKTIELNEEYNLSTNGGGF